MWGYVQKEIIFILSSIYTWIFPCCFSFCFNSTFFVIFFFQDSFVTYQSSFFVPRFYLISLSPQSCKLPNPVFKKPIQIFLKVYLSHRNLAFILLSLKHISYLVTSVPLGPVIYIIISHSWVNQHSYLQCLLIWHIVVFPLLWPLNFKLLSYLSLFESDFLYFTLRFFFFSPSITFQFSLPCIS